MKVKLITNTRTCRWRKFSHKPYAVFCSLKREVNIGVLAVSTLAFANPQAVSAQQLTQTDSTKEHRLDEVQVTGSRVPLTLGEAARIVTVLSRDDIQHATVHSVNDLLKYVAGVDVRQRGAFGVQTDIGIRGGSSNQTTILLNGANICNPQGNYNTADFPVSLDDIERIELLEGPASRVYGTSAFSGAINIVTKIPSKSSAKINIGTGMHGLFEGGGAANIAKGQWNNQLSAGVSRSDGYITSSDFNIQRAFYQGSYSHPEANVYWQVGYINKDFGANTFYSTNFPNQFEHTRRYLTSVRVETKGALHFTPLLYWNRDEDRFELTKGKQDYSWSKYNYHQMDTYGVNLNTYFTTSLGKTSFGAEFRNEGIISTLLGTTLKDSVKIAGTNRYYTKGANRTNVSYYAEHDILTSRLSISMGLMAGMNTGLDHKFRLYPGIDASYRLSDKMKLYASWGKALRMPTYTDLYYTTTKTHVGNPNLKPEESQAFDLGIRYTSHAITGKIEAFYHRGKNMIDWIKTPTSGDVWYSMNLTKLNTIGGEADMTLNFNRLFNTQNSLLQTLHLDYAYTYQNKKEASGYLSESALDFLRHKFVAQLDHRICSRLNADWSFRWQDRASTNSFCLVDLKINWNADKYLIYIQADNLLDRKYSDHIGVPQPGFWGSIGFNYKFDL